MLLLYCSTCILCWLPVVSGALRLMLYIVVTDLHHCSCKCSAHQFCS
jgi:hypothetical protein